MAPACWGSSFMSSGAFEASSLSPYRHTVAGWRRGGCGVLAQLGGGRGRRGCAWEGSNRGIVCGIVCVQCCSGQHTVGRACLPPASSWCAPVSGSKEKLLQLYAPSPAALAHSIQATNNETDDNTMKAELERVDFGGAVKYTHQHGSALFPGRSGSSSQQKQGFSLFDFNPHKGALGLNLQVGGCAALLLMLLLPT